jgi:DNA-binding transcriptional ArsR family regulator
MRPAIPPSPEDSRAGPAAAAESTDVDRVFAALADPTRRRLLQILATRRPLSASALAGEVPVTRQAVAQHLAVLQQSHLVAGRRVGREVLYSVQPGPLLATATWMTALADTWSDRLHLLKDLAESGSREAGPQSGQGGEAESGP